MHFGHCEQFALVDVDEDGPQAAEAPRSLTPPPHEPGLLPRWLHEQGADVVIAGGMGQRAQQLFAQSGIRVLVVRAGGHAGGIGCGLPGWQPEARTEHL